MAVEPLVLIIGLAVVFSPLAPALRIETQARRFQQEAFGHLARAARNLRLATWVVFAFYVLVIGGSFATNQYEGIFSWPLEKGHYFVYLRIVAVTAAYLLFGMVASELYQVTVPGGARNRRV